MKAGISLQELAAELDRQSDTKKDFVLNTKQMAVTIDSDRPKLEIEDHGQFEMKDTFHRQVASRLKVPKPYYDRMLQDAPALLANNINHWLHEEPAGRMIRTLDGSARAMLSPKFRRLDNDELVRAALPAISESGARVESCQITDTRLYLKCVTERVQGQIRVGEVAYAGFVLSNSEIGMGSLSAEELAFILKCLNGWIMGKPIRKTHVGRGHEVLDNARELYTEETQRLDNEAFFAKVQDVVRGMVTQERFDKLLDRAQEAQENRFEDPVKAVEVLANWYKFNDDETRDVLKYLTKGGELSQFGLTQAVTRAAQDVESYDRSTELEKVGGEIITLPRSDWTRIEKAAA